MTKESAPVLSRSRRWNHAWPVAAVATTLAVLIPIACDDSLLVAPTGATVTVAVNPTVVGVEGDSAVIAATVLTTDGELVDDDTRVVFSSTLGALCATLGPSCTEVGAPTLTAGTKDGIARVHLRTGNAPGQATLTARSGKATGTATLMVSGLVAPTNATVTLTATPQSIAPQTGVSRIDVFLGTSGTPVQDGTRVRFSATSGVATPPIALTHGGFVSATLAAVGATGTVYVRAISGSVRDSIAITIK